MKQMNKQDMYNTVIIINPCYGSYIKSVKINELLTTYKHIVLDWYDIKYNRKPHLHKQDQYRQLIGSHLYDIHTSKELEYLKKNNYQEELLDRYDPHLHILLDIPPKEQLSYFKFVQKKMRIKYPFSSCVFKALPYNEEDQIREIDYCIKEVGCIPYSHYDLQNGVI